nr:leucine-rich repeat protein [uncultured Porphyromonas sp.]
MNTPKAVADELLALINDRDEIKKALIELGAVVADDDGLSSYPDKIRGLTPTPIKIFKSQQFYQWKDEALPPAKIDDGYTSGDLSWCFARCPNLTSVPSVEGIDKAVSMESFIQESVKVKKLTLPDLPNLTSMRSFAHKASSLESVVVGAMPQNASLFYSFAECTSLRSVTIGDVSKVTDVFAAFYACTKLQRVKLSLGAGMVSNAQYLFDGCAMLEEVEGIIDLSVATNIANLITRCPNLREIRLKGAARELIAFQSVALSLESVRYLINEAKSVSTGTVMYLPQSLVDRHPAEMAELGGVASGKGWTITYR